jgi:hypothetical protein
MTDKQDQARDSNCWQTDRLVKEPQPNERRELEAGGELGKEVSILELVEQRRLHRLAVPFRVQLGTRVQEIQPQRWKPQG